MNRRLLLLTGLALLAGCATAPAPVVAPARSSFGELEPLYAARASRDALIISVSSNGCTTKADFAFYVERKGESVTLAFGRKRLDTCRSFAMGRTELSFSYEELGVSTRTPVFLLNPLMAWAGPGD